MDIEYLFKCYLSIYEHEARYKLHLLITIIKEYNQDKFTY